MKQETLPGFEDLVVEDEQIELDEAQQISADAMAEFEDMLADGANNSAGPLLAPYEDLMATGCWAWRQALYIAWARLPAKARWPTTLEELAVVMGLRSARTIRKWRTKNPEIDRHVKTAILRTVFDRTADVLDASADVAITADYKGFNDRKMLLEIAGVYRNKQDLNVSGRVITADQMAEMNQQAQDEIEDWESERFADNGSDPDGE